MVPDGAGQIEPNGGAVTPSSSRSLGRSSITVTMLTRRSTTWLSRHDLVPSPRSARFPFSAPACVPAVGKGGESRMFNKPLVALRREDGQTMAEYGVVLAVITLAVVVALAALSGAIGDAINAVTGLL